MEKSVFQFTNPVLNSLELVINDEFINTDKNNIQIKTSLSVNISRNDEKSEAVVLLNCEVGEISESCPFYLKAEEKANFKWKDGTDDALVNDLLNQNAPSLLLSYLRPIVSHTTMSTQYGAYNIPFFNFTAPKKK